ncbi:MAG: lipoate--protein ligase family protein [Planctomycetes bacterium]|nr:lipoate--protein ligase family protein [Planctomycetota bacterium]
MPRTWRLITTWGAPPAFNMGLDEALLERRDAPPTLRFYSWSPDTLSLGYFQRWADVPGTARAGAVVRRITGGGAIHHVNELTFSFSASADDPLYVGKVADSYCRVHKAIAAALAGLGVEATLLCDGAAASDVAGTGMCFHAGTPQDLVWGGRKGVGSAQRRTGGRVLHHGSIKLGTSPLEGDIATLREAAPGLDAGALAPRLLDAFREHLDLAFEVGVPTPEERERARELGARYVDPSFLRRR